MTEPTWKDLTWKDRIIAVLGFIIFGPLAVFLIGLIIEGFFRFVPALLFKLRDFTHIWWLTLFGTIVISCIGLGLFCFRKYFQKMYGLTEVAFALAFGWSSMRVQFTGGSASWISILASAYLVVRRLSNFDQDRKLKS